MQVCEAPVFMLQIGQWHRAAPPAGGICMIPDFEAVAFFYRHNGRHI